MKEVITVHCSTYARSSLWFKNCWKVILKSLCQMFTVFTSRYGPPLKTTNKVVVENLSTRVSWQVWEFHCNYSITYNTVFISI